MRKREVLPIYGPSFIHIRVEIDLCCLYRRVPQILLYHPEIFGPPIQFRRIGMPYFVRRNPIRSPLFEDMLHRPWLQCMPHLPYKERTINPPANEPIDIIQRILIDKDQPDFPAFS